MIANEIRIQFTGYALRCRVEGYAIIFSFRFLVFCGIFKFDDCGVRKRRRAVRVARSDTAAAVAAATVAPTVALAAPTATPLAEQAPPSQVAQVFARTRAIERVRYKITSR
ncbi:MAG: hypothetical protein DCC52_11045 [Chloroflexi bacterium]|nr:MAG: hypothetical protein DCC52_11045 [Chloroflexota bacterium]